MNHQLQQEGHFAGRHSENMAYKVNYGYPPKDQMEEYRHHHDVSYNPMDNRLNIFERKLSHREQKVPRTKHRFKQAHFTKVLQPDITDAVFVNNQYHNDKLDVKDIAGTSPDAYKRFRRFVGRDTLNVSDIDKTKPQPLKQNLASHLQDLILDVSDISGKKNLMPRAKRDPLDPVYKIESPSRRGVKEYGKIEGSSPVSKTLPKTRRKINQTRDIPGASPKDRGTIPSHAKLKLTSSHDSLERMPTENMRNTNSSKDNGAIFIADESLSPKSIAPLNHNNTIDLSYHKAPTVDRAVGTSRRKSYLAYTGQQSLQQYTGTRIVEKKGLNEYVAQAKRNLNMSGILDPRYSKSNSRERPKASRRLDFGARSLAPNSPMDMYASANHDQRSSSNHRADGSHRQVGGYPPAHTITPAPLVLESSIERQMRKNPNLQKPFLNPITHTPPPFKQGGSLPFSPPVVASGRAFK